MAIILWLSDLPSTAHEMNNNCRISITCVINFIDRDWKVAVQQNNWGGA
jgi:hypothetical protein